MIRQVLRSGLYQGIVHYLQRAPPPSQTTTPTAAALQVMLLYKTHKSYLEHHIYSLFSQYGDIMDFYHEEVTVVLLWIPLVALPTLKL